MEHNLQQITQMLPQSTLFAHTQPCESHQTFPVEAKLLHSFEAAALGVTPFRNVGRNFGSILAQITNRGLLKIQIQAQKWSKSETNGK